MNVRTLVSIRPTRVPLLLLIAALVFALSSIGCGKRATSPERVPLSLEAAGTGATTVRALPAASLSATDSTNTSDVEVTFTRALLVVRDVRFHTPEEGENNTTDITDEETAALFRGPFVIDLLSHHAAVLDTELVPPGLYQRVQGHLQALHDGDAAATTDLSFLVGSTVHLEGSIAGEGGGPFVYEARIDDEFQIHGAFTVESHTPATAFLVFDLTQWLVDNEGRFLDPRNPENDLAIRSAIRHAIKIGPDADHDGVMDAE